MSTVLSLNATLLKKTSQIVSLHRTSEDTVVFTWNASFHPAQEAHKHPSKYAVLTVPCLLFNDYSISVVYYDSEILFYARGIEKYFQLFGNLAPTVETAIVETRALVAMRWHSYQLSASNLAVSSGPTILPLYRMPRTVPNATTPMSLGKVLLETAAAYNLGYKFPCHSPWI